MSTSTSISHSGADLRTSRKYRRTSAISGRELSGDHPVGLLEIRDRVDHPTLLSREGPAELALVQVLRREWGRPVLLGDEVLDGDDEVAYVGETG